MELMNAQIEAAGIAGIVSLISLGGTVVVAIRGYHASQQAADKATAATLQAAETAAKEAHRDTDRTLGEQHVRTLNERFATAADMMGTDKPPPVRLAGVYAMAGLADDWKDNRQTCIDVLCGYLRIPYAPDPGDKEGRLLFLADREVRHTVIRVITAHLRKGATFSWPRMDFDFTGVVFDGGDFSGAVFSGGVAFGDAQFSGGDVDFSDAQYSGGEVDFSDVRDWSVPPNFPWTDGPPPCVKLPPKQNQGQS
jgi:hypothetical protein